MVVVIVASFCFSPHCRIPMIFLPLRRGHLPPKRHLPLSFSLSLKQLGMQGISKLAMGSAMVVAVCLFLVFVILLMLYVELCCSFLWQRRRRRRLQTPLPTTAVSGSDSASSTKLHSKSQGEDEVTTAARDGQKGGSPGSPFQKPAVSPTAPAYYAHGVLQTPASFFFTTVPHGPTLAAPTKQNEMLGSKERASLHFIGLIPSASFYHQRWQHRRQLHTGRALCLHLQSHLRRHLQRHWRQR